MASKLSLDRVGLILALNREGKTQTLIAQTLGIDQSTVSNTLMRLADTRDVAKARINAAAQKLAERVVKHADVDQSLEILDRISVIEKRQQQTGHATVAVVIGMPGQPAGVDPLQVIDIKELSENSV